MKSALKSLLAILVSVGLCLFITWVYLRGRALAKPVPEPLDHPFSQSLDSVVVAHRGGWQERPENTMMALEHAAALSDNVILWVDVRPTKDRTLVLFRDRNLETTTNGKGWIGFTPDAELFQLDAGYQFQTSDGSYPYRGQGLKIPTLNEALQKFPNHRWILNFHDYGPGMADVIIKTIKEFKMSDRVLIASPEDGILRDMREKEAMWLYGTSQAQATRMKMMAALGLEPVVPLQGDVFVLETVTKRPSLYSLSDSILKEVHRRKLKIIAGPSYNKEDALEMRRRGINGVMTGEPSTLVDQAKR